MTWLYYLLEANAYLLVFYSFYKLVLQHETFYSLNRFYLLFTSLLSFILPCFQFSVLRPAPAVMMPVSYYSTIAPASIRVIQEAPAFWTTSSICLTVYAFILLFMLIKFAIRLYRLFSLINQYGVERENGVKKIWMKNEQVSFSFLSYLFIDPQLPGALTIIRHETAHIRHYHTVDVLFFELLHIINWFNPVLILLKKEIKTVHEFIADEETLNNEIDAENYSMFLIHHSYNSVQQELTNQMFSGHLLKKRIVKLHQKRSAQAAKWKYAMVLPVLLLLICLSSAAFTKPYGIDLLPQKQQYLVPLNYKIENASIKNQTASPIHPDLPPPAIYRKKKEISETDVQQADNLPAGQYQQINIDAKTDTVKIRTTPGKRPAEEFKGIFVIGDKIYSKPELRDALKATGKMDMVLASRPIVGIYSANDENAIKRWGARAKEGVMFIIPRKDSIANSIFP